jgi:hypothetical protein
MKTFQDRQQQIRRERVEAVIEGRIGSLFQRLPMLCGFALEADLQPAEVSVHSWPGYVAGEDLYNEIVNALADLVDERPDAVELLRGRTFARAIQ